MNTTLDFLDAVKARHSIPSDYQLAKYLGITQQEVSKLRNQKAYLGDSTALRVSKLLELDPAEVLAAVHSERAKNPDEKAAWASIFERLTTAAACAIVGVALSVPAPTAQASQGQERPGFCILCKIKRRYQKAIKFPIPGLFPNFSFSPLLR